MMSTECTAGLSNSVGNLGVKGATGVDLTFEVGEYFNAFEILTMNLNRRF